MATIDVEEREVTAVEDFLCLLVETFDIRIVLLIILIALADLRPAEALRVGQHVQIQLRHLYLHATGCERVDARLVVLQVGIVITVVALHAHGIDAEAFGFQRTHELADAVTLCRRGQVIVVVVKFSVGVGGMSEAEGQLDVVRTYDIIIRSVSQRAVIVEGLVDHIPSFDASTVVAHHCGDVVIHAVDEHLACDRLTLVVGEHPAWRLGMPDETMTKDSETVLLSKGHRLVSVAPVIAVLFGVDDLTLHAVLGHDGIEVILYDVCLHRVSLPYDGRVHGGTDVEVLAYGLLERGRAVLSTGSQRGYETESNQQVAFDVVHA